jgi:hypothetical protein
MEMIDQLRALSALPPEKEPPLPKEAGWVQEPVWITAVAGRNNPSLCKEPNPGCPVRSLVTRLTELPRLQISKSGIEIEDPVFAVGI